MNWPFKKPQSAPQTPIQPKPGTENPALKAALATYRQEPCAATFAALVPLLNSAQFLVPVNMDSVKMESAGDNGKVTLQPGTPIQFLSFTEPDNRCFLLAFTDHLEIDAWMEAHPWTAKKWASGVIPALMLWGLALKDQQHLAGVRINPARNGLELHQQHILNLARMLKQPTPSPSIDSRKISENMDELEVKRQMQVMMDAPTAFPVPEAIQGAVAEVLSRYGWVASAYLVQLTYPEEIGVIPEKRPCLTLCVEAETQPDAQLRNQFSIEIGRAVDGKLAEWAFMDIMVASTEMLTEVRAKTAPFYSRAEKQD